MFLGYIGVLDSGVGGLSLLKKLVDALPNEQFLYLGDNKNAPYGNKPKRELLSLTIKNLSLMQTYPLKAIVVACNTLSTNVLYEIKKFCSVPIFPIFPPVELCKIKRRKTLLLATCASADNYSSDKFCDVLGLMDLAGEIERKMFNLDKVNFLKNLREKSRGNFIDKKGYYECIILGCTHYEFIKNKILDHFCPQYVLSGADFTTKNLSKYIYKKKSLVNCLKNQVLFIGECSRVNEAFYNLVYFNNKKS